MQLPCGVFHTEYGQDHAWWQTKFVWLRMMIGFAVLYLAIPFLLHGYWLTVAIMVCYYIIAAAGVQLITGYSGQITIGQAAFMCVGAFTSAILTGKLGFPFLPALLCAAFLAGFAGVLFGLPTARVKGFYLVLTTLMAQFVIVDWLAMKLHPLTGGPSGLVVPPASIGPLIFNTDTRDYLLMLTFAILSVFIVANLMRTKAGRAWTAIRDNDIAAETIGVNIVRYKLFAFFMGSFLGGIAGALWAHTTGFISHEHFPLFTGLWVLGIILIGGMGSIYGIVYGAIFLTVIIEGLRSLLTPLIATYPFLGEVPYHFTSILFGLAIILFLVFEPNGLSYRWWRIKRSIHLWPFSY